MNILPNYQNDESNQQSLDQTHESLSESSSINVSNQNLFQYLLQNINFQQAHKLDGFADSRSIALSGLYVFQNIFHTVSKLEKTVTDLRLEKQMLISYKSQLNQQNEKLRKDNQQLSKKLEELQLKNTTQSKQLQIKQKQILKLNARIQDISKKLQNSMKASEKPVQPQAIFDVLSQTMSTLAQNLRQLSAQNVTQKISTLTQNINYLATQNITQQVNSLTKNINQLAAQIEKVKKFSSEKYGQFDPQQWYQFLNQCHNSSQEISQIGQSVSQLSLIVINTQR